MQNRQIQIGRDYASIVSNRGNDSLPPKGFQPNWDDQPSRFKMYYDVERFPLSAQQATIPGSLTEIIQHIEQPRLQPAALSFEAFSTMLQYSIGILNRRLGVNWNHDHRKRSVFHESRNSHSRGSASGGGMYPMEVYWVSGQSSPLMPGVYHYDTGHHAMERLFVGDASAYVREAVFHHPAAQTTDQFLLISLNFWKNAFKYTSFCYHVVTEDLGAFLGALRFLAVGYQSETPLLLWYNDELLNRVLGLETVDESVFAVIPLPLISPVPLSSAPQIQTQPLQTSLINKASFQRSKTVLRFPMNEQIHRSALITDELRPQPSEAYKASSDQREALEGAEYVDLPKPDFAALNNDLLDVFQRRQTSFGRFSNHQPLTQNELATLLHFGAAARHTVTDLKESDGHPHYTRLATFINNVEGLDQGVYSYDARQHRLWGIQKGNMTQFLQDNYFLSNYNLAEIAAVFTVIGRINPMLETYGNRGLRVLHAEVGSVAQSVYMAASALPVGCGAALGFNNIIIDSYLGFDTTDDKTLLFLLVGHNRKGDAYFNYRLA